MEEYQVAVVGPPECGKTVYLATLNHVLSRRWIAPGLSAVVKPAIMGSRLAAIYRQIADPRSDFPKATLLSEIHEWRFEFRVAAAGRTYPLMSVKYFDAGGEWWTRPLTDGREADTWHTLIERMDAVLGFLDGDQLGRYLDGSLSESAFYAAAIDWLMPALNECGGPVHIVVTKWDLLQGRYSLQDVQRAMSRWLHPLADDRPIRGRGHVRRARRVRIIPVTSLGSFAYLDSRGLVHKRKDAEPAPVNVLIPFAAVLPDLVIEAARVNAREWREQLLQRARENAEASRLQLFNVSLPINFFWAWLAGCLAGAGRMPTGLLGSPPSLARVNGSDDAYRYMQKCLFQKLREFERNWPGSRVA
jgi:Double-GTPase 2